MLVNFDEADYSYDKLNPMQVNYPNNTIVSNNVSRLCVP